MKKVLMNMLNIFSPDGVDWMGFYLSKNNPYTYHHIKEKKCGGPMDVDNGSILTKYAHQFLNILEKNCIDAYNDYQYIFKKINDSKSCISDELKEEIYGMLMDLFYDQIYIMPKEHNYNFDDLGKRYLKYTRKV